STSDAGCPVRSAAQGSPRSESPPLSRKSLGIPAPRRCRPRQEPILLSSYLVCLLIALDRVHQIIHPIDSTILVYIVDHARDGHGAVTSLIVISIRQRRPQRQERMSGLSVYFASRYETESP